MTQPAEIEPYPSLDSPPPAPAEGDPAVPVEEAPTEPATGPDAAAKTKLDEVSALAKAEKARWRESKRLKAEQRAYQERDAARERQIQALQAEVQRAKTDYLAYAEENGMTPEKLAETLVQRGTTEHEIAQLRAQLEEVKQASERQAKESQLAAYKIGL